MQGNCLDGYPARIHWSSGEAEIARWEEAEKRERGVSSGCFASWRRAEDKLSWTWTAYSLQACFSLHYSPDWLIHVKDHILQQVIAERCHVLEKSNDNMSLLLNGVLTAHSNVVCLVLNDQITRLYKTWVGIVQAFVPKAVLLGPHMLGWSKAIGLLITYLATRFSSASPALAPEIGMIFNALVCLLYTRTVQRVTVVIHTGCGSSPQPLADRYRIGE